MGINTEFKKWLLFTFGGNGALSFFPPITMPPVVFMDYNSVMKGLCKQNHPKTGEEYFRNNVRRPIDRYYENGAHAVWVIFDRGSPINKYAEHELRSKDVIPMTLPDDYADEDMRNAFFCDEEGIPGSAEWKSYVSNRLLIQELLHYITLKFLGPAENIVDEALKKDVVDSDLYSLLMSGKEPCSHFVPPISKTLCIHGGRPKQPSRADARSSKFYPAKVITITNEVVSGARGGNSHDSVRKTVNVSSHHPISVTNALLEGEMAMFKYAMDYSDDDLMMDTPDGDVLLMALLSCQDRIDESTGKFRNVVYVRLRIPGGVDQYVNVNLLWDNINAYEDECLRNGEDFTSVTRSLIQNHMKREDKTFSSPFWLTLCGLGALNGTDYVKNYCKGIGTCALDKCASFLPTSKKTNYDGSYDVLFKKAHYDEKKRNLEAALKRARSSEEGRGEADFLKSELFQLNKEISADVVKQCSSYRANAIPFVAMTFLKNRKTYWNMFSLQKASLNASSNGDDDEGSNRGRHHYHRHHLSNFYYRLKIDENLFIEFTRSVYLCKYGSLESLAKLRGRSPGIEDVRWYLNDYKKELHLKELEKFSKNPNPVDSEKFHDKMKKRTETRYANRMMEARKIRVTCRNLLWQLWYWTNGYKGSCSLLDPLTLYEDSGLSYYGWEQTEDGKCSVAHRVSKLLDDRMDSGKFR